MASITIIAEKEDQLDLILFFLTTEEFGFPYEVQRTTQEDE